MRSWLRQSFKPGEVTPEEANRIGYELASRFLGDEHAFIVAAHNDRHHVHNHIVFCPITLDAKRKFRNVYRSDKVLAEMSDQICHEHGLSVIRESNEKTESYEKCIDGIDTTTRRDVLRIMIDAALRMKPDSFDALMQLLEDAGCAIKRGAQISIKPPGTNRYIRLDTMGHEYKEEALRQALDGKRVHIPKRSRGKMTQSQIELLVDIEAKMRAGKGMRYARWAHRHNTDAIAQSMIYLKEHHIESYDELADKIHALKGKQTKIKNDVRTIQARMKEISEQKKAILTYRRTKDVYAKYRESGWSPTFYREHKAEIEAHKQAQAVYSAAGGRLPTIAELSAKFNELLAQKRELNDALPQINDEIKDLRRAKSKVGKMPDDEHCEENQRRERDREEMEHEQEAQTANR